MSSGSGYAGQPTGLTRSSGGARQVASSSGSTNLADLLERVLDKGIVIAGDITVSLGQVELLSIKLRLIVASIDKAQEIGIDWWRSDPALSSQARQLEQQNQELRTRLDRMEQRLPALPAPQQAPGAASFTNNQGRAGAPDQGAPANAPINAANPGANGRPANPVNPGAPSQPATANTPSAPNPANDATNAGSQSQPAPSGPPNGAGPARPEANGGS